MIRRLGYRFAAFFRATTPDPFILAIGLTIVVFGLAGAVQAAGPVEIIEAWQGDKGFWSLLAFTMQMVLILVTGHALASAPPIERVIRRVAAIPRSGATAAALVASVAMSTALLNWGLGLVVGAILAREVGRSASRRGIPLHYPLLAAAGYTGLMCWHGGLSGTAPLMMTTEANVIRFLGEELATEIGTLAFTQTVFGVPNLIITGGLLVLVPVLCGAMAPKQGEPCEPIEAFIGDEKHRIPEEKEASLPERIERSPWVTAVVVAPLLCALALWFMDEGFARLEPNALNLLFLTLGLVLHGTVRHYLDAVNDAVQGTAGIVLQFPFYAGIMGVMRTTGLGATFASSISALSSARAYAALTMVSAAVINLFVPSGGGQWAVQGPIAVEVCRDLGIPFETAVMAVAYGDQLSNMLQPFWALPLLAITGVRARDIVGYTALLMLVGGLWVGACLIVMSP